MELDVWLYYSTGESVDCPHSICRAGSEKARDYVRDIFSGTVAETKQRFLDFMAKLHVSEIASSKTIQWADARTVLQTMAWLIEHSDSDADQVTAA